jgi:hypothetical protein
MTYIDGSGSHVYSFACISALLYYFRKHALTGKQKYLNAYSAVLGLIIIIRPINLIAFLFTPFLFENLRTFLEYFKKLLFVKYLSLIVPFLLFFLFIFIQLLLWYWQTGDFIVYSYGEERFDFKSPYLMESLFGFKKGLFIYTPLFLLAILLFFFTHLKKYYSLLTFGIGFFILLYITSSWHCWWYGMSFGLRPFIDYSSIFILIFVLGLNKIQWQMKTLVYFASLAIVYIQLIQSYQFKNFILHWDQMNKEKYWKVFLHTEERYQGLLWTNTEEHDPNNYKLLKSDSVNLKIIPYALPSNFPHNYSQILSQKLDTSIVYSKVGITYLVKNASEDDLKIMINILDVETNESLSYNYYRLFHHIKYFNKDNELNYIAKLSKTPKNSVKILIEFYEILGSNIEEITIKNINYYE